ncbi:MAG: PD-(D/E)XK nuclease family protein [Candidatus Vogelbacteria bacterium]|nr:PD-(D/E)XK nuclease family protein [Candidatus Vogelbacteria bacterium]
MTQADLFGTTEGKKKSDHKGSEKPWVKKPGRLFDPSSKEPFKLSRTKIENFIKCPRCFYLDRRLGVGQPPGFPFSLNSAVDHLLKKEFDAHRIKQEAHPLMKEYGLKAIPFSHPKMEEWRENFVGVQALHKPTNLLVFGAVDDLWVGEAGEIHVVDYKATAKDGEVSLDADWQISYKNQVEIYQWLLRQNSLKVSNTAYFVYANGQKDRMAFDGKLEFTVKLIPYEGKADWVEDMLISIKSCLLSPELPEVDPNCEYCAYRAAAKAVERG